MSNKLGDKSGDKNNVAGAPLNETQTRMLAEIRNNPNITKEQLSTKIGKGKTTVDNGIAVLKEKGYMVIGMLNVKNQNRAFCASQEGNLK